jgi:hypothetical protein
VSDATSTSPTGTSDSAAGTAKAEAVVEKAAAKAGSAASTAEKKVESAAATAKAEVKDVAAKAETGAKQAAAKADKAVDTAAADAKAAVEDKPAPKPERSMAEIEAELDATRARLAERIDELTDYVAPKNVLDRQVGKVKGIFVDEYGGIKPDRVLMAAGAVVAVVVLLGITRRRRG